MKVLYIDSDREKRHQMKRGLGHPFRVTTLSSSTEAIAFARSHVFDIVMVAADIRDDLSPTEMINILKHVSSIYFVAVLLDNKRESSQSNAFHATLPRKFTYMELLSIIADVDSSRRTPIPIYRK